MDVRLPDGTVIKDVPRGTTKAELMRRLQKVRPQEQGSILDLTGPGAGPMAIGRQVTPTPDTGGLSDIGLTAGASTIAEPLAGLAGIAQGANPFAAPGAAQEAVQGVRESLSVPLGEEGQQLVGRVAGGIPESVMKSIIDMTQRYEGFADLAAEAFGPAAGAAVKTAPTALLTAIGIKGSKQMLKQSGRSMFMSRGRLAKELKDAAPGIDEMKNAARSLYTQASNSGAALKNDQVRMLLAKSRAALKTTGASKPRRAPGLFAELEDIKDLAANGNNMPIDDLMELRQALSNVSPTADHKAAAMAFMDQVDDVLDNLTSAKMTGGDGNVGETLKTARELWRRSSRAQAVQQAIDKAPLARSGAENGFRIEFQKLLNSKESRFFNAQDKAVIQDVVKGGLTANNLKRIGRFGIGEGASTSVTSFAAGSGLGAFLYGPSGAVILPVLGSVSRPLARKLTENASRFALDVVKAGADAKRIVATYMTHVPPSKRVPQELAQLLMNPRTSLDGIGGEPLISQAKVFAMMARTRQAELMAGAAAGAQGNQSQQ